MMMQRSGIGGVALLLLQAVVMLQIAALWSSTHSPRVEALPYNKTAYELLPKVNADGPYYGLIIPNPYELAPFLNASFFSENPTIPYLDLGGRRYYIGTVEGKKIIAVMCGLAMLNAGITTQQLIDFFNITGILHYGIAGGSDDALHIGDVSIPKQWAHTGLWNWQRYGDGLNTPLSLESDGDFTRAYGALQIGNYDVPPAKPMGNFSANLLNNVWYQPEEVFSVLGVPEVRAHAFWVYVDSHYYKLAKRLTGVKLANCYNGTCLNNPPKVVVGKRGGAASVFVDNAAYRSFIFDQFKISSVDMESSAIALVCLANDVPFIAFRSLSDLAGGSASPNQIATFSGLAAGNAVMVLRAFIQML